MNNVSVEPSLLTLLAPIPNLRSLKRAHPAAVADFLLKLDNATNAVSSTTTTQATATAVQLRAKLFDSLHKGTVDLSNHVLAPLLADVVTLVECWCAMTTADISPTELYKRRSFSPCLATAILPLSATRDAFLVNSVVAVTSTVLALANNAKQAPSSPQTESGDDKWCIDVDDESATIPLVSPKSHPKHEACFQVASIARALTLFGVFVAVAYAMVGVQMWSDGQTLSNAGGMPLKPLRDIVYETMIPEWIKRLPETIVDTPITCGVLGSFVFSLWTGGKHDPTKYLRRSILVLIITYLLRSVSIAVTQVPPSNPAYCRPFPDSLNDYLIDSVNMLTSKTKSCSDMMFSGHTTVLSAVLMRIWYDSRNSNLGTIPRRVVRCVALLVYLSSLIVFVAVRLHYTMDVLVGAVIGLSWSAFIEFSCETVAVVGGRRSMFQRLIEWVEGSCPPSCKEE
ncbi:hypothetical protein HDU78_003184 [Chytriomyces hyalinus]|nr:hypothetical protein HDU78_003184 [Chytriomyces hyalinus]